MNRDASYEGKQMHCFEKRMVKIRFLMLHKVKSYT